MEEQWEKGARRLLGAEPVVGWLSHTLGLDGRVKVGFGACLPYKDTEGAGSSPAVADGLGEETQVLVDLQAVLELQDRFLIVLEDGQSISEHHLGHSGVQVGYRPRQVLLGGAGGGHDSATPGIWRFLAGQSGSLGPQSVGGSGREGQVTGSPKGSLKHCFMPGR